MLNISFFITVSTSISWLVYCVKYLSFHAVSAESLFHNVVVLFFPVAVIWGVLAVIYGFYKQKNEAAQTFHILNQLKKSAETNGILAQTLLNAEIDVKNGFLMQQCNTLISDINEILSDVIRRSNSVSSMQMEHLWTRTAGGERWLIAKTFIEINGYQPDFSNHLMQKAQKDSLLKGSILEFCVRYENICELLECVDKQKIFYNMIECGALGRTFSILSPLAKALEEKRVVVDASVKQRRPVLQKNTDFALKEEVLTFPSFLTAGSPDVKTKVSQQEMVEENKSSVNIEEGMRAIREEILSSTKNREEGGKSVMTEFSQTQSALRSFHKSAPKKEKKTQDNKIPSSISLDEIEKEINASPENNYDEYAYPFGNLFNDKKNK